MNANSYIDLEYYKDVTVVTQQTSVSQVVGWQKLIWKTLTKVLVHTLTAGELQAGMSWRFNGS